MGTKSCGRGCDGQSQTNGDESLSARLRGSTGLVGPLQGVGGSNQSALLGGILDPVMGEASAKGSTITTNRQYRSKLDECSHYN